MEITVTGRHTSVPERFRRHIEDKLAKVSQLDPRVTRCDVVVTHEANPRQAKESRRIEITCYAKRSVIRAEAAADEEYAALDLAMTRLGERLRRSHDKRVNRGRKQPARQGAAPDLPSTLEEPPAPQEPEVPAEIAKIGGEGDVPVQLREKVHTSSPMSLDQALNNMELVGHDFYLYVDAETTRPCVVYRRRGWSYGVIQLEVVEAAAEADGEDVATA